MTKKRKPALKELLKVLAVQRAEVDAHIVKTREADRVRQKAYNVRTDAEHTVKDTRKQILEHHQDKFLAAIGKLIGWRPSGNSSIITVRVPMKKVPALLRKFSYGTIRLPIVGYDRLVLEVHWTHRPHHPQSNHPKDQVDTLIVSIEHSHSRQRIETLLKCGLPRPAKAVIAQCKEEMTKHYEKSVATMVVK